MVCCSTPSITPTLDMLTYEISVEQGAQQLLPLGKGPEDLGGGKGGVQEQAATHAVEALAQKAGQHQQVVVMDPHIVIVHADHLN